MDRAFAFHCELGVFEEFSKMTDYIWFVFL